MSFGECRHRRIVVDEHRRAQTLLEHLAQRHVGERQVDRCDHASGLEFDNGGDTDAHAVELMAAQALDDCDQLLYERGGTGSLRRYDHRCAQLQPLQRARGNLRATEVDPYDPHGSRGGVLSVHAAENAAGARDSQERCASTQSVRTINLRIAAAYCVPGRGDED